MPRQPRPEPDALTPIQRVASGTPPVEQERLALQERSHPDAAPLEIQTFIWLLRAYSAAMSEFAASLRSLDLSPSAFNVIQALANTPDQRLEPCQLAERLLVSRPSVTGLIDTLEAKALVVRGPHPQDRRRVLVWLTDRARDLLRDHASEHYATLRRITGALSEDEQDTLVTLLRRIHGVVPPALVSPLAHPADA